MKASTVKTFLDVHSWTGLGTGMALFIAFYAGAMTVFFHELEIWESYHKTTVIEQQTIEQAQQLLDQAVEAQPDMDGNLRLYPAEPDHPENVVRWFERLEDGTFERHEFRLAEDGTLDRSEDNAHLASFVYVLHYTAGLPNSFGIYVLGIVSLIYGLALVTGLIIFLPNLLRDLFNLRIGKNKKRFWLDSHNAVGVISLPWHMMFAWSSVVLCIGIFMIAPFQLLVFEEDMIELLGPELGLVQTLEATEKPGEVFPVSEILAIAQREAPGFSPSQMRFTNYGDQNTTVQIVGSSNTETLLTNAGVTLNGTTGEVLGVTHPDTSGMGAIFYSGLIALHYVSFGGYFVKWLYFVMGLAGAFLFYSGNLLWIETRRKRRQLDQRGNTIFLARLNSGVCIGCMAGVSAAFLASRALMEMDNRPDITEWTYYLVFFASIAWAFLRPVAAGARDLLYACAFFTALIPVFDGMFLGIPIWESLRLTEWPLFSVSFLSILAAAGFWWMGQSVHRRAVSGDSNSVWALPVNADDRPSSRGAVA
ncbi:MAG: PepSY domain-containing protein [Pseudomonadales bacterium]|nr:PepSY domain-containing protein [Pseudomonadales bacterium]